MERTDFEYLGTSIVGTRGNFSISDRANDIADGLRPLDQAHLEVDNDASFVVDACYAREHKPQQGMVIRPRPLRTQRIIGSR